MASGPAPRTSGVGCATLIGIALGVVVLLGVLTCGGGAYWAFTPGRQADTARLVGEESLGYVEIADLSSSKPVVELLKKIFEELEKRDTRGADVPSWMSATQSARDYQGFLDYVLPNSLVATLEPAEDGIDWMSAANFSSFTRPAKLMLTAFAQSKDEGGQSPAVSVPYGDATIYQFPEGAALTFVDGTFVAAGASPAAQRAIDRLRDAQPSHARLRELELPRPGRWDARGVLSGPMLPMLGIEPDRAQTARLGLRVEDPDRASAYLVVDCPGETDAGSVEQALREQLAGLAGQLSEEGLEVEYQVVRTAAAVDVDLKLQGVSNYLLSKLESGGEEDAVPEAGQEEPMEEEAPPDTPAEDGADPQA